jgi:hypothetical protein
LLHYSPTEAMVPSSVYLTNGLLSTLGCSNLPTGYMGGDSLLPGRGTGDGAGGREQEGGG